MAQWRYVNDAINITRHVPTYISNHQHINVTLIIQTSNEVGDHKASFQDEWCQGFRMSVSKAPSGGVEFVCGGSAGECG